MWWGLVRAEVLTTNFLPIGAHRSLTYLINHKGVADMITIIVLTILVEGLLYSFGQARLLF